MPLSCGCDEDSCTWFFFPPKDYTSAHVIGRRHRCTCGDLIDHGSTCLKFDIFRYPTSDIEERIYGDEVPLAARWLCERCADLYFSFVELGFDCVNPEENMLELIAEYADLTQA
jgi:hypothetical protein